MEPDALLAGLDPEQEAAVRLTSGPVAILAGAGSGKTRVISHRVAYAAATGVVDPARVLVVTFTDKAAGEMASRLRGLGLPGVAARTFHAAALAQLRYFWPLRHDGAPAPDVLDSKVPIVGRLARDLPGGYRFTPAKDLADEIEWAKSRRLTPATYADAAALDGRRPPVPAELFVRLWRDYERAKDRQGRLDFDDMLTRTVELLETDADAAEIVHGRYQWFSVDEYQDTNPLQQRLLELWLGERDDLCVVGDEDQSIYGFTGATPEFLTGFAARWPGARAVELTRNYRSSPQILELANRLLAAEGRSKRLVATLPAGPEPSLRPFADAAAEERAVADTAKRWIAEGIAPAEIAVLVRTNAQIPPIEAALTRAGVPYRVRGGRFFERPEVREVLSLLRRRPPSGSGAALVDALEARLRADLGFDPDGPAAEAGRAAEERTEALALLLEIARDAVHRDSSTDAAALLAVLTARAGEEAAGSDSGVDLLTLHRAKGLEWDAVILPQLEEGTLPIGQASEPDGVAEERRLLYVGLTRARRHLALSWARRRPSVRDRDREVQRQASRFLIALERHDAGRRPPVAGGGRGAGIHVFEGAPMPGRAAAPAGDATLLDALKAWRTAHARADGVPAYVIATDALLEGLVEARPVSLAGLRRVKGMGPMKLEKYGEELLALLAADR